MTDEPAARVCPRCGTEAGDDEYCSNCGLALIEQPELPSRAEWEQHWQGWRGPPDAGLRTPPKPGTVEYLINACYWTIGLSLLMPLLALPAWGFAFLIILRGRRDYGLWLFFLAAFVSVGATVAWLAIFGVFAGTSSVTPSPAGE